MNDNRKRDRKTGWSLRDLIDFEALSAKTLPWKKAWRDGVRDDLESAAPISEKARRRIGFRWMLNAVRAEESVGGKILNTTRLVSTCMAAVMFLIGVGVVRGLLTEFSYQDIKLIPPGEGEEIDSAEYLTHHEKGFNVWILLAATLGLQWLLLVVGFFGYWCWRKWSGSMTYLEAGAEWIIRKLNRGKIEDTVWDRLKLRLTAGRSVFGWRLTRMLQFGGMAYNLGLLVGLFGCLLFLNVGFYWETTLPQFGEKSLQNVTHVMSLPVGGNFPSESAIKTTKQGMIPDLSTDTEPIVSSVSPRMRAYMSWANFFLWTFIIWGLLPRLLMWLGSVSMEKRSLAALEFQESHHRNLWREVTKVERGEVRSGLSDGVVLLDIGGLEIKTEDIRPYLLQELRVNPEARFSLGTLDQEGEKQALNAAREAAMGVVFLVEGWNLSPKQMAVHHTQVRESIGANHTIRYLMVGTPEEMTEWTKFVDSLRDSEAEIYHYQGAEFDAAKNAT